MLCRLLLRNPSSLRPPLSGIGRRAMDLGRSPVRAASSGTAHAAELNEASLQPRKNAKEDYNFDLWTKGIVLLPMCALGVHFWSNHQRKRQLMKKTILEAFEEAGGFKNPRELVEDLEGAVRRVDEACQILLEREVEMADEVCQFLKEVEQNIDKVRQGLKEQEIDDVHLILEVEKVYKVIREAERKVEKLYQIIRELERKAKEKN